MEHTQEMTRK